MSRLDARLEKYRRKRERRKSLVILMIALLLIGANVALVFYHEEVVSRIRLMVYGDPATVSAE